MYRAYALVAPSATVTPQSLVPLLAAAFPDSSVTLNGKQITIARGDWEFELLEEDAPDVLTESQEIAEKMAGQLEDAEVASCARRFHIWSETPDPELEHFEKYQTVVGLLKTVPGIIVIDPSEPSFL